MVLGLSIGEMIGIPNLRALTEEDPHIELRIYLFDEYRKVVRSSVLTVLCKVDRPKDFRTKQYLSNKWKLLQDELQQIAVRAESYLSLVFDFVHISDKKGSYQISTAWTSLCLDKLQFGNKKLFLKGGSPFDRFESPI